MKLFIDTANTEEIRKANDLGVICGVTTNPSQQKVAFILPIFPKVGKQTSTKTALLWRNSPLQRRQSYSTDSRVANSTHNRAYFTPFLATLTQISKGGAGTY